MINTDFNIFYGGCSESLRFGCDLVGAGGQRERAIEPIARCGCFALKPSSNIRDANSGAEYLSPLFISDCANQTALSALPP